MSHIQSNNKYFGLGAVTPIYPQESQFVALNQHFYLSLCKLSLNIEHTYLCTFSFSRNCCCNSSRCVRKFSSRSSFSVHSSSFLLNFLWKFNTCWFLSISCSRNHASLVSVSSIFSLHLCFRSSFSVNCFY